MKKIRTMNMLSTTQIWQFNAALRAGMTTRWIKIENAHAESTELLLFFVKRIVY